jgi:hypothetical protein
VVKIDLHSFLLQGLLPDILSTITTLRAINLGNNRFSGNLPASWSKLQRLEYLNLSDNYNLGGALPKSWGDLRRLRFLYLSYNKLSGPLPPEWSGMVRLQAFKVLVNQLTGPLPWQWRSMKRLQILELGWNFFSGPFPWQWRAMTKLEYFYIAWNLRVTGCLPREWRNRVRLFDEKAHRYTQQVGQATEGTLFRTQITGWC